MMVLPLFNLWTCVFCNISCTDDGTVTRFPRGTAGYTLFDHKRNEEILEELEVETVEEEPRKYQSKWPRHVIRMNKSTIPENNAEL